MTPNSAGAQRGDRELLCPHPAVPPGMSPIRATHCLLCVPWCQHPLGAWSGPIWGCPPMAPPPPAPMGGGLPAFHQVLDVSGVIAGSLLVTPGGFGDIRGTCEGHTAPHMPACAACQDRPPLRGTEGVTLGCHPLLTAPPKQLEAKQEPLPIRMLLLAPVWMLCPGRIQPDPPLIKKFIYIAELQTVPHSCRKTSSPVLLLFPALATPRHQH